MKLLIEKLYLLPLLRLRCPGVGGRNTCHDRNTGTGNEMLVVQYIGNNVEQFFISFENVQEM